jgi:hypothetical protein
MSICPLVGVEVSPVPPFATATVPVKLIFGVDPPLDAIGELALTLVTPPPAETEALETHTPPILVNTFPAVPGATKLMVGVVPPVDKIGYVFPTLVTALATAPVAVNTPVLVENESPFPTATFAN